MAKQKQKEATRTMGLGTRSLFHGHTTRSLIYAPSDRVAYSPEEFVKEARRQKVHLVAITDHDIFGADKEAQSKADELGVQLIPNCAEISCHMNWLRTRYHVHFLVYDPEVVEPIDQLTAHGRGLKVEQAKETIFELQAKYGFELPDEIIARIDEKTDKGQIARWMIQYNLERLKALQKKHETLYPGIFSHGVSYTDPVWFRKMFILGSSPFEPLKANLSGYNVEAFQLINLVNSLGGHIALAHPWMTIDPNDKKTQKESNFRIPDAAIIAMAHAGLRGVEVLHPKQTTETAKHLLALIEAHNAKEPKYSLAPSSKYAMEDAGYTLAPLYSPDYHSPNQPVPIFDPRLVPVVNDMLKGLKNRNAFAAMVAMQRELARRKIERLKIYNIPEK